VLSDHGDEAGKVQALDQGADDYITKPFSLDELMARIRVAVRHQSHLNSERPIFRTRDLSVDVIRHVVKIAEREVKLSPKEYELLRVLVQYVGKVLTHKFLLRELWDAQVDAQYLRVYVRHLRQKIEADPSRPLYILTVTGVGYRLRAADQLQGEASHKYDDLVLPRTDVVVCLGAADQLWVRQRFVGPSAPPLY
jgi:two-component system, OmpR family, KDP operon response regulator KdpE